MTRQLILSLVLALAGCANKNPATAAPSTAETGEVAPFEASDLAGAWTSGCVDPGNAQGIALDFDLTASDWVLDYQTFGDAACAAPFLTVHVEGPYTLGAPSATVPGARDAEFGFATKTVTPHSDEAAAFLSSAYGCGRPGFVTGQAADLAEGCAGLGQYPIETCGADHDIVLLEGDTLRFGNRPADNDLCTDAKRPTEPSPVPLTRS